MKIKSNRDILNARIQEAGKRLETYEMQKSLLLMAKTKAVKAKNPRIASLAQARTRGIEANAAWERGLITGYKVSLTLIK